MVNVFPFYVTSTAQDWFFSLEEGDRRYLQRLKEAFLKRFQRRNLEYSLQNIKQQSEAVDDYINRILAQTVDRKVPEGILVGMMLTQPPTQSPIQLPTQQPSQLKFLPRPEDFEKTTTETAGSKSRTSVATANVTQRVTTTDTTGIPTNSANKWSPATRDTWI
ncbi:unnamed protein product [Mytilus coruscus]|uniref:Retrotransposon gag domain-containing protein n=1 Tax=Mytilus coruscus TaxID=42192 RepID=A0A6J8ALH8_MYTCO|nr:unnamed protein product [Mytilus coruscus]